MKEKTLSVILLSYYSSDRLRIVYDNVRRVFEANHIPFEFIIMDDGSKDDSYQVALELEQKHPNIKAYQLSRNYTSNFSIFAGLSVCEGECATAIPDDDQQPYEMLVDLYREWEKGQKIIIPHREIRNDKSFSTITSLLFYASINKFADFKYPKGGADTFFIDREIIDVLKDRIRPLNTYIVPELLKLGFNPYFYPYIRPKSVQRKSRWTFKKRFKLAKDILLSSSDFPIKMISFLGISISMMSFILIITYVYIKLFGNSSFWGYIPPGWTSIVLFIMFFSGLILFSLGILAEYIWRIFEEVKDRPPFLIRNKNINDSIKNIEKK